MSAGTSAENGYEIEHNIISKINLLNSEYYTNCLNGQCDSNSISKIEGYISEISALIVKLKNSQEYNDLFLQQDADSYNDLLNKYQTIVNVRNKLNNEIDNIKNVDQSNSNQLTMLSDAALYSNIGWSLLATTVVYYVFMNISK